LPIFFQLLLLLFVILCSLNSSSCILLQAIFCYWVTSNLFSLSYGMGKELQNSHLQYHIVLFTNSVRWNLDLFQWNVYFLGHWFCHGIHDCFKYCWCHCHWWDFELGDHSFVNKGLKFHYTTPKIQVLSFLVSQNLNLNLVLLTWIMASKLSVCSSFRLRN
jgi:hypothetical protein